MYDYVKRYGRFALLITILFVFINRTPVMSRAGIAGSDEPNNIERLATKRVQPPYPPLAQKYKIEGIVVVQVTVGKDGTVGKAEFVRGHNIFRSVSLDAAKRWEFKRPDRDTLEGTIHFTFKLND